MALATSVIGDGILVSTTSEINEYYSRIGWTMYKFVETTTVEVREWVALTKSAAKAAAEAASQDGLPTGATASYHASEDNRVIGSYKLTKTITTKTTNIPWEE